MNKIIVTLVIALFFFGLVALVVAADDKSNIRDSRLQRRNSREENFSKDMDKENRMHNETRREEMEKQTKEEAEYNESNETQKKHPNRGIGQILSKEIKQRRQEYKEGNFTGPMGRFLQVKKLSRELRELRSGNVSAQTDLNLTVGIDENNKTRLNVHFKNGKGKEIKVMPETASERAIERLGLKVCSAANNCTIVLKEVGQGNETNAHYDIQVERHYRILGLFKAKAKNKAEIDADNGDVVVAEKPWWSFLAKSED